jgi:hypothetical protein
MMNEYEKIENSSDDEETKDMKKIALEVTLKTSISGYTTTLLMKSGFFKVPDDVEQYLKQKQENPKIAEESGALHNNIIKAIYNSTQKLTFNFIDSLTSLAGQTTSSGDMPTTVSYNNVKYSRTLVTDIKAQLDKGIPVVTNHGNGHFVLVYAYYSGSNTDNSLKYYKVLDPGSSTVSNLEDAETKWGTIVDKRIYN